MKTILLSLCLCIFTLAHASAQQYKVTIEEPGQQGTQEQQSTTPSPQSGQQPPPAPQYQFQKSGSGSPLYEFQKTGPFPPNFIEINANTETFEARWVGRFKFFPRGLSMGVSALASSEDYYYGGLEFTYGSRTFGEPFSFDIGMKGVLGEAEAGDLTSTIGAVGFLLVAGYDIPVFDLFYSGLQLDLDLWGELTLAPSPMSFDETDSFSEARGELIINLTQNKTSALLFGYRQVNIDFKNDNNGDWDKSDGSWLFGYRFRF